MATTDQSLLEQLAQAEAAFVQWSTDPDNLAALDPPTRLAAVQQAVASGLGRDRDQSIKSMQFGPDSLTGSYFRAPDQDDPEAEAAWIDGSGGAEVRGQVVGQPFATSTTTMYLVEFYAQGHATGHQQLVDIDRMLVQRWAFYDTEAWLEQGQVQTTEREATSS
jgi:hypothetical protein